MYKRQVYSGLLVGLGVGLVLRVGSSTGGMDIPPVILHEKMGLPLAGLMYSFDTVILLCQIGYSSAEQVLFGVLEVLISALVMSRVLLLGKSQTQAMIISPKYQEISQAIQEQLERGTTLLAATTGYLLANQQVVMAVVCLLYTSAAASSSLNRGICEGRAISPGARPASGRPARESAGDPPSGRRPCRSC